jgi:hypothetical protein
MISWTSHSAMPLIAIGGSPLSAELLRAVQNYT